jgi:hypothetical protein
LTGCVCGRDITPLDHVSIYLRHAPDRPRLTASSGTRVPRPQQQPDGTRSRTGALPAGCGWCCAERECRRSDIAVWRAACDTGKTRQTQPGQHAAPHTLSRRTVGGSSLRTHRACCPCAARCSDALRSAPPRGGERPWARGSHRRCARRIPRAGRPGARHRHPAVLRAATGPGGHKVVSGATASISGGRAPARTYGDHILGPQRPHAVTLGNPALSFPGSPEPPRTGLNLDDQEGRLCCHHRGSTRMSCGNVQFGGTGSPSRGRRFGGWASS